MESAEHSSRKKVLLGGLVLEIVILVGGLYWYQETRGAKVLREDVAAATLPPWMDGTHPCVYASLTGDTMVTRLGRCATPTEHAGAVDRFETDLRYGAFVLRQTDLRLKDVFDVPLTRSYSTHEWVAANPVHAFGLFSSHPYDIVPLGTRRPYTYLMLELEDGDYLYFKRISKGDGFADAVYMHVETSTKYYKAIIRWNGDGWTVRLADGEEMLFPEAYASKNDAQGAAYEVRNASGDKLVLKRDSARNLEQIRTPHGHWIKFQYDDQARVIRADDDQGNWTRYAYDGGLLSSVVHSSGTERHYEYAGMLMTAILDEHGRMLVRNEYDSGKLVHQAFANGDQYAYSYDWNPDKTYPESVRVTLPDHSEKMLTVRDSVPDSTRQPGG